MPDWELELHLLQLRPSAAKKKKKKWERNRISGSEVLVVYYRDKAGQVEGWLSERIKC